MMEEKPKAFFLTYLYISMALWLSDIDDESVLDEATEQGHVSVHLHRDLALPQPGRYHLLRLYQVQEQ